MTELIDVDRSGCGCGFTINLITPSRNRSKGERDLETMIRTGMIRRTS
jgi:hypothetical protein